MSCNCNCNRMCPRAIYSNSVSVITIDGTDTLVIDIPAGTYGDCKRYCLFIIQAIPSTATINMPVAISIGGVTTTVYPLTRCDCSQVTACAVRTRTRYPVIVATSGTGGVFKVLKGLSCAPNNALSSLPVTTTATPATARAAESDSASVTSVKAVSKTSSAKTQVKSE